MSDQIPTPPDSDPVWAVTDAVREDIKWADEDALKGQKNNNELRALKAIGFATVVLIIFFLAIFLVSLGAWIWHQVMPETKHWLSDGQLASIQSVIFSGAIGAVVTSYAQKHLSK